MAVIESKGDGYSLFNGVKLPSLPEWDKETYTNATLAQSSSTIMLAVSTVPYVYDGTRLSCTGAHKRCLFRKTESDESWVSVQIDQEISGTGPLSSSYVALWSNFDILNTSDETVYLAASDPTSLDGMNVIEWDGDFSDVMWDYGDGSYGIVPYAKASNAIAVWDGKVYTEFDCNSGSWWVEDGGDYGYAAFAEDYEAHCICACSLDWQDTVYTSLIAYTPVEETATVDYTITYETAYGTAPDSLTVTVNEGESYALTADDLPTLEAEGYIFNGWLIDSSTASVGDTISADTTLTAVWEADTPSMSTAKKYLFRRIFPPPIARALIKKG